MAENEAPHGASEGTEEATEAVETDWKSEARKWENRAKENLAAARANEDAAKRLTEIEDAQKSETQRQQEALEQAQRELASVKQEAARLRIAAKHGIGEDHLDLLTGTDEEELEAKAVKLAALIKADAQEQSPFPKPDPSQGVRGTPVGGTNADSFASFIGAKLN